MTEQSVPVPGTPRKIELRFFLNGGEEVSQEAFLEALAAPGGRARVEAFEIREPAYRPTAEAEAALEGLRARKRLLLRERPGEEVRP